MELKCRNFFRLREVSTKFDEGISKLNEVTNETYMGHIAESV